MKASTRLRMMTEVCRISEQGAMLVDKKADYA